MRRVWGTPTWPGEASRERAHLKLVWEGGSLQVKKNVGSFQVALSPLPVPGGILGFLGHSSVSLRVLAALFGYHVVLAHHPAQVPFKAPLKVRITFWIS